MNIQKFKYIKFNNIYTSKWIMILAFILVTFTTAFTGAEDKGVKIRVISFNIAAGLGDLDEIVKLIKKYDPDIVALQEVDVNWSERSDFEHQARYLGEKMNMYYFFGEIYTLEPENDPAPPRQFGLGYISKIPIIYQQNHLLSRLSTQTPDQELRVLPGFPEIVVAIEDQQVHFFTTHLDYRRDPVVRLTQVEEMIEIMKDVSGPIILMGDLNARPEAEEISQLFEILNDTWDFKDDPGYTFPADQPDRRIDYILHSDHFEVLDVFVAETEASDHRPVVADLYYK